VSQFGNVSLSPGDQSRAADMRPEVFKESYPSIFKMVEVLESRASKSRDLEVRVERCYEFTLHSDSVYILTSIDSISILSI
jgi:hypothetical protein